MDVVLVLAALSVLAALIRPLHERSALQTRMDETASAVERTREAVIRYRDQEGSWPPASEAGRPPDALVPFLRGAVDFDTEAYRLQIRQWAAVRRPAPLPFDPEPADLPAAADTIPVPQPRAVTLTGLTVQASDPTVLATLLATYGHADSFVRDSTWTLVFPRRDDEP
jgi:hypothetical protein